MAVSNDFRSIHNNLTSSQRAVILALVLAMAAIRVNGLLVPSEVAFVASSLGSPRGTRIPAKNLLVYSQRRSIIVPPIYQNNRFFFPKAYIMASTAEETTTNETVAIDATVLKKLDDEIKAATKRRQRLEDKLRVMDAKILDIVTKKNMYLDRAKLGVIPVARTFKETKTRSAVKAMLWRIIAGSITFVTAFKFSRSISTALTIVGSDFFSKSFTMFLGERLMNKSKMGRKRGSDGVRRSLVKALLWRIFALANTLVAAVFISKDLSIASKIAGSDAIIKTTLMFLYERSWAKVEWGKKYQVDFTI